MCGGAGKGDALPLHVDCHLFSPASGECVGCGARGCPACMLEGGPDPGHQCPTDPANCWKMHLKENASPLLRIRRALFGQRKGSSPSSPCGASSGFASPSTRPRRDFTMYSLRALYAETASRCCAIGPLFACLCYPLSSPRPRP